MSKGPTAHLEPKLQAVLEHLCHRLGPLMKTRAVKLPYLVDVVASQALGRRIAGGTYQTWEHGVVTREVFAFMTHTSGNPKLRVEDHDFSEGGKQVRIEGEPTQLLDEDELAIVDEVADEYGRMDAARLGMLTKALNTHLPQEVWGSNHAPSLDDDAYSRLADGWRAFFERLPALDFTDASKIQPVGDPREHLRSALGA